MDNIKNNLKGGISPHLIKNIKEMSDSELLNTFLHKYIPWYMRKEYIDEIYRRHLDFLIVDKRRLEYRQYFD
jgi:hypothetical protein